jgi:hypothetical protein
VTRQNESLSVEKWLDSIDTESNPGRSGRHLSAIGAALTARDDAERDLQKAIREAHAAGDSWDAIGAVLGTSRQAAHRKYAKKR